MSQRINIKRGETGRKIMPHSEVCMYMQIAGQTFDFYLKKGEYSGVQLLKDGREYSGSITTGEAGVFQDEDGFYYYENDSGV